VTAGAGNDATGTELAGETPRPVLIEVGARFGLRDLAWADLVDSGQVRCYLIEPDEVESERLERQHPRALVRCVALGAANGTGTLHSTRHPAVASLREPNWELLTRYAIEPWFEIEQRRPVRLRRLDDLVKEGQLEVPDFLHVDVQGYEAEVLQGAGSLLPGITGLKLELHPVPLYQGEQSLFEVGAWLCGLGFRVAAVRQQGPYEGDFVEANCFFVNQQREATVRGRRLAELFIAAHGLRPADQPDRDIAHVTRRLREVEEQKRRTGWISPARYEVGEVRGQH
jgi:FkbM family methyltransferase